MTMESNPSLPNSPNMLNNTKSNIVHIGSKVPLNTRNQPLNLFSTSENFPHLQHQNQYPHQSSNTSKLNISSNNNNSYSINPNLYYNMNAKNQHLATNHGDLTLATGDNDMVNRLAPYWDDKNGNTVRRTDGVDWDLNSNNDVIDEEIPPIVLPDDVFIDEKGSVSGMSKILAYNCKKVVYHILANIMISNTFRK